MKKKGSITVFLSLIMVLLFSMIVTTLEAARIMGASAYLSMLTELSEDSFLASYYYPMFQEYRLFGVDAGNKTAYLSEDFLSGKLEGHVSYGLQNTEGGIFHWNDVSAEVESYATLLSNQGNGFFHQVKEQAVLEGITISATELFDTETLHDAAWVGEVYEQQEEALIAVSTVTQEFLSLMELVDGIRMSDQGLDLDKEGRLQAESYFLKQILPVRKEELKELWDNEEVFRTVENRLMHLPDKAKEIKELIEEAEYLEEQLVYYDELLAVGEEEEKQQAREERDELVEHLDLVWMDAEEQYMELQQVVYGVENRLRVAEGVLDTLEQKQRSAQLVVGGYEQYLKGKKGQISDELYQVFAQELHTMKLYLGMEEQGYHVGMMKQTVASDVGILESFSLSGFSKKEPDRIIAEMRQIQYGMSDYTADGLWFFYGDIVAGQPLPGNIFRTLGTLLTNSVLELAGVDEVSDKVLSGVDLPSGGTLGQCMGTGVKDGMEAVKELILQGEWEEFLDGFADIVTDKAAMEVYCSVFFGDYTSPLGYTRLLYEREYLVFGQKKDAQNLLLSVLAILALRLLLCIVDTLKSPERMAQLQGFAIGLVGFTGIPALVSVVKYALLFLWALEEAFVAVAAILQGKRISVLPGEGQIAFLEIFQFSKAMVKQKAEGIKETAWGAGYGEYLALFSLLGPVKRQAYHALDLIQENIRYRYRETFRIRNMVIELQGTLAAELKKKYDAGLFPEKVYQLECKAECSY